MKLGKLPARPGAIRLKLRTYAYLSVLPTPPAEFGHEALVTEIYAMQWGLLGNDSVGDCVVAGGGHETMAWNAAGGLIVPFSTPNTLADYSAITGYDPADPSTDQGADMQVAAAYRQKTGLLDAAGNRHKVGAYLAVDPGDLEMLLTAAYVFEAVGVGITFPQSAMDQFNAGQPWDAVAGSPIEGGHYVPGLARRGGMFKFITWGAEQLATDAFLAANNDENVVYLSPDMLAGGKSLEGFDLAQLTSDLAALTA